MREKMAKNAAAGKKYAERKVRAKVLCWMLSFVVALSILPLMSGAVMGADPIQWIEINEVPTTGGYYKLSKDVTIENPWEVKSDTFLDLNGNSITYTGSGGPVIIIGNGAQLTLNDSKTGGKITGGSMSGVSIGCGKFVMYGGSITGNSSNANDYGGGVTIYKAHDYSNSFEMYGGSITYNRSKKGGGVYIVNGESRNTPESVKFKGTQMALLPMK